MTAPPTPLMQRVLDLLDGGMPQSRWTSFTIHDLSHEMGRTVTMNTIFGLIARGLVEWSGAGGFRIADEGKRWREAQARKARVEERKRELLAEALGRRA